MDDLISRQQAIDTIEKHLKWTTIPDYYPGIFKAVRGWLNGLPSIQSERKDALEKAVVVEAISDELMSRFDISATYAYEVAEAAINRIEVMAKEIGKE